ncbi:MAG: peptide MFS transporter, partial [Flavobacteriales bacterium]
MSNADKKNEIQMLFGHPKGLWFMFGTEMWERFGYYLMLGIFSLYMLDGWNNGGMGFDGQLKSDIYGTYLGLVYLTPFIGGLLADRLLGYRRSIIIGGLMMAAGYFMLAMHTIPSFYIALLLIILGNGFFKPNISTLVGNLYSEESLKDKKDAGFNIFYMGINIGAFVCNFVAAFMRINYGWGHAFAAAGVGMLLGVVIFSIGNKHIKNYDVVKPLQEGDMSTLKILGLTVLPMFVFGIIGYLIPGNLLGTDTNDAFIIGCLPVIGFFIYLAFKSEAKESRAIKALLAVFTCVILFFAIFHQNGDALTVWAEDYTDREMPSSITGAADAAGMAQLVENSPMITDSATYAASMSFLNVTQSALPKETKDDFKNLKECAEKIERIDKSYKYFSNLSESDIPALKANKVETAIAAAIKGDSILQDAEKLMLMRLAETPSQQLPSALSDKKSIAVLAVETAKQIKDSEAALAKTKDADEQKALQGELSSLNSALHVFNYLQKNELIQKSSTDAPNLKLYSTELYQSINPFWVVILTPVMVGIWGFFRRKKKEPSTPAKIAIGLVITALSALVMVGAVFATNGLSAKAGSMWLLASYGVITIGELCLSPMGLSLVSKLSPPRITALMMGGYFLAISVGNKMSGMLSSLWEGFDANSKQNFFYLNFALVLGAALLLFLMLRWLNRVMKENNVL